MLIGLAGYAQSGKNTTADILCAEHGFQQRAFADPLREALLRLNPIITAVDDGIHLRDIVEEHGWEFAKRYRECRELLQRMGTEVGREMFGQNFWVDYCLNGEGGETDLAITDVRFTNEADAIHARGGVLVRIVRDGYGPINGHRSETDLDEYPFDIIIENNGSLDDLRGKVSDVMRALQQQP